MKKNSYVVYILDRFNSIVLYVDIATRNARCGLKRHITAKHNDARQDKEKEERG